MRQIHIYAYTVADQWHISADVVDIADDHERVRWQIYRGDHTPMDDESAEFQAVQIIGQMSRDLLDGMDNVEAAYAGLT